MYIIVIGSPSRHQFYSLTKDGVRAGRTIGKSTSCGYHQARRYKTITDAKEQLGHWQRLLERINATKGILDNDPRWYAEIQLYMPPMMIGQKLAISKKPRRSKKSAV